MPNGISKRQQLRNEKTLAELIRTVPGNDRCADCEALTPGWFRAPTHASRTLLTMPGQSQHGQAGMYAFSVTSAPPCTNFRTDRFPRQMGIFLCMRCAAIHRKLGTHISKVKSMTMDTWSSEQVDVSGFGPSHCCLGADGGF